MNMKRYEFTGMKKKQEGDKMNNTIIYTINPESNQIVLKSAEEVAKMTGIDIEKIQSMQDGDFLTDGTEN